MALDFATRAEMLRREVEELARMGAYSPHEEGPSLGSVLNLSRGAIAGVGAPWLSGMMPEPSGEASAPLRRDLARERNERRALSAPIAPRNSHPVSRGAASQAGKSRVSLNDSTGSTPSVSTPPKTPVADVEHAQAGADRGLPVADVRWTDDEWSDRIGRKKTAAERAERAAAPGGGSDGGWSDAPIYSPLNLSKCVSLLDEADLAGLVADEVELAKQERARQLMREVQEAASKSFAEEEEQAELPRPDAASQPFADFAAERGAAPSPHADGRMRGLGECKGEQGAPQPSHPSPLAPSPASMVSSESPFCGVELSLD